MEKFASKLRRSIWWTIAWLLDFHPACDKNRGEVVAMLESRDPSSLGERIRAGKADPISPEEFEVIDRIKTKFIALYGEERAAQLTGDQYEKEVAGRIIAKYEAR